MLQRHGQIGAGKGIEPEVDESGVSVRRDLGLGLEVLDELRDDLLDRVTAWPLRPHGH
jgi:hypothetical protein